MFQFVKKTQFPHLLLLGDLLHAHLEMSKTRKLTFCETLPPLITLFTPVIWDLQLANQQLQVNIVSFLGTQKCKSYIHSIVCWQQVLNGEKIQTEVRAHH